MKMVSHTLSELFKIGMKRNIQPFYHLDGRVLNLGCGEHKIEGAINLDLPDWDAKCNSLPFVGKSVGLIHMHHFMEHLDSETIVKLLIECQRILIPGGSIYITVPHFSCAMAHQDINHKTTFTEKTFEILFGQGYYETSQGVSKNVGWKLKQISCIIMGLNTKNLALFYCLQKV
jgi:SAM-dependent methyltransferase